MKPTAKQCPGHDDEYDKMETAFKARGMSLRRVTGLRSPVGVEEDFTTEQMHEIENKLTEATLPNMSLSVEDVDEVARRLEEELAGLDVEKIAANVRREINEKIAEEHPELPAR